jgi:hypothetical protein
MTLHFAMETKWRKCHTSNLHQKSWNRVIATAVMREFSWNFSLAPELVHVQKVTCLFESKSGTAGTSIVTC